MQIFKYIIERFKKINQMSRDYVDGDPGFLKRVYLYLDLAYSIVVYGCGITDYFQYQFYKRKAGERKDFIVHRKRMWLVNRFNDPEGRKIFDHKPSFNWTFNQYLGRAWLDISKSTFEDFKVFAKQTARFLVKPAVGSHGIGVRVIYKVEIDELEKLFAKLKSEQALVEELIEQHLELAEFNPSSVNTLRVVTLLGPGDSVNIMTANLRLGNGEDRFADNFHHNGIAALIDVKSGEVISKGVDKNLNYYSIHPLSGKEITGFIVPEWEEVISLVSKAALVASTVGYVGWDLAIGKDGQVMLVEGNAAADPDISQMPDQVGKWPLFREIVAKF